MTGTLSPDVNEQTFPATRKPRQTGLQIALQDVQRQLAKVAELEGKLQAQVELTAKFEVLLAEQKQEHLDYTAERAEAHMTELTKVTKDLGYATSSRDSWSRQHTELQNEMNALHDVLDLLGNCPPKVYKDGNNYDQHRSLLTRFAIWQAASLAQK